MKSFARRLVVRLVVLAVALVAVVVGAAVPAQANEGALRERAHARIAAILDDAAVSGLYSTTQVNYITSAVLPTYVPAKDLSPKAEVRAVDGFWKIVTFETGVTESQARSRLSNGATLRRITGDAAEDVQERLYRWLAKPVFAAFVEGEISASESATLRDDIGRAVDRLMRQPGGSDGPVVVSPRRN